MNLQNHFTPKTASNRHHSKKDFYNLELNFNKIIKMFLFCLNTFVTNINTFTESIFSESNVLQDLFLQDNQFFTFILKVLKDIKNNYSIVFNKLVILMRLAITNNNILSVFLKGIKDVYPYIYTHSVSIAQVSYKTAIQYIIKHCFQVYTNN
jgi:hypothetical protein